MKTYFLTGSTFLISTEEQNVMLSHYSFCQITYQKFFFSDSVALKINNIKPDIWAGIPSSIFRFSQTVRDSPNLQKVQLKLKQSEGGDCLKKLYQEILYKKKETFRNFSASHTDLALVVPRKISAIKDISESLYPSDKF